MALGEKFIQLEAIVPMENNSSILLLTARQVAKILDISESAVYQLTKEGSLGYVKVLRSRKMFTVELIREFIQSKTVNPRTLRLANGRYLWETE